jgi:hypothetical protein
MIDLIIPTLWKCNDYFLSNIEKYVEYDNIKKIIIIDNDFLNRPKNQIFKHNKILLCRSNQNMFVNPAWNYGVYKSQSEIICLLNDDVFLDNFIVNRVSTLDFENIDIIGSLISDRMDLELEKIEVPKNKNIGNCYYGFGFCMFMSRKKYKNIPSLYKIWYGDDYLVRNSSNVYRIAFEKKCVRISQTINQCLESHHVKKRIQMDINNSERFLFKKIFL